MSGRGIVECCVVNAHFIPYITAPLAMTLASESDENSSDVFSDIPSWLGFVPTLCMSGAREEHFKAGDIKIRLCKYR